MGRYVDFTEVSMATRTSIRGQPRETTIARVPDEPPDSCLLLERVSELVDVLWLVRLSPDTSPEDVPHMFN